MHPAFEAGELTADGFTKAFHTAPVAMQAYARKGHFSTCTWGTRRTWRGLLLEKAVPRAFLRGLVKARIGYPLQPNLRLRVQVCIAVKLPSVDEALPHIADGALHATRQSRWVLCLWSSPGRACTRGAGSSSDGRSGTGHAIHRSEPGWATLSLHQVRRILARLSGCLGHAVRPVSAEEKRAALRDRADSTPAERENAEAAAREAMERIRNTRKADRGG